MEKSMSAFALFLGDELAVENILEYKEGAKDYKNGKVSFWKYLTCANYRYGWDTAM